jgi:hypothetical protein
MDTVNLVTRTEVELLDKPHSGHGVSTKPKLMSFNDLDGRTLAARRAKQLVSSIKKDIGCGDDEELTTGQQQLATHAAILGAMIESVAAQWLLGQPVDLATFSMLINTQRRVLAELTG